MLLNKILTNQSTSVIFFFSCLKLPPRGLLPAMVAELCRVRPPLIPCLSCPSLSVGECMEPTLRLDMELDRFKLEEIPRLLGQGFKMSRSSPGKHDSTIMAFSRQLTKSSAVSELPVDLEKVPANRHKPPNPIAGRAKRKDLVKVG